MPFFIICRHQGWNVASLATRPWHTVTAVNYLVFDWLVLCKWGRPVTLSGKTESSVWSLEYKFFKTFSLVKTCSAGRCHRFGSRTKRSVLRLIRTRAIDMSERKINRCFVCFALTFCFDIVCLCFAFLDHFIHFICSITVQLERDKRKSCSLALFFSVWIFHPV